MAPHRAYPTSLAERVAILVVDDDDLMADALSRLLSDDFTRVSVAHSAAEALNRMGTEPADIIVSDQVMPGMDGVQLLELVREKWPETRRVLCTGQPGPDTVIASVNRGGVHKVVAKPFHHEEMRSTIAELVNDCLAARAKRQASLGDQVTDAERTALDEQLHDREPPED